MIARHSKSGAAGRHASVAGRRRGVLGRLVHLCLPVGGAVALGTIATVAAVAANNNPPPSAPKADTAAPAKSAPAAGDPLAPVRAYLSAQCYDCHSGDTVKGSLDLEKAAFDPAQPADVAKWVRVYDRVAKGEMPPPKKAKADAKPGDAAAAKKPVPADADRERPAFLASLARPLTAASAARAHTVFRRLNRFEYENTLRDLLGVHTDVQDLLPEDGKAYGFDNVGEALDLSPVQLQRYMEAAGKALDDAVCRGPQPKFETVSPPIEGQRNKQFIGKDWLKKPDGTIVVFSDSGYPPVRPADFHVPVDGRYKFRVTAYSYQSKTPVTTAVYLGSDGNQGEMHAGYFSFPLDTPTTIEVDAQVRKNATIRLMAQDLPNSYNALKKDGPENYKGPGLAIVKFEVEGPIIEQWPTRGHLLRFGGVEATDPKAGTAAAKNNKYYKPTYEVVSADPDKDLPRVLLGFATAAFRRPVAAAEVTPYVELAKSEMAAGGKYEAALRTAEIAVLCSPDFLYLAEPTGKLDDYALASRLSYFFWSSLPDAALIDAAAKKQLSTPAGLRAQAERMLADPKASRLTENFVGQWLNLRDIDATIPDKQLYPEYDDQLKFAMVAETERFFGEVLHKNQSTLDFVDSDWTFVNERLARHYGLEGVAGTEMRRVPLKPEDHRGGVLTQAAVLKVSANGTTTSPVVRGAYVLDRILGFRPPPPPPGITGIEPDIRGATTLRQQLDQHRNNATCVSCHKVIDPPGFALESYDVMGGWRENYRSLGKQFPSPKTVPPGAKRGAWKVGPKVDASGETVAGAKFDDLAGYKKALLADKDGLARAMAEKVATYATGRGMGFSDRPAIDKVVKATAAKGYGFRDLVYEVVQSEIFRTK